MEDESAVTNTAAEPGDEGPAGSDSDARRRRPAGAAVLREDVTAAIRLAVFTELAELGFARMSIEGVARRAGVGKTAVYRRWKSKLELVLDVVSSVAELGVPAPDTGSLEGDVRALLDVAARGLTNPVAATVVPDLVSEAARQPEIASDVKAVLLDEQRGIAARIVHAAVARGDLPESTRPDRLLDLTVGPLYWHVVVVREPLPRGYLDDLTRAAVAALTALTEGACPGGR